MSAVIQNEYTGNGSTTTYSFTFPYLKTSDIKASRDGVETTAFTLPNATTLQFNTAPGNGEKIKIFRQTSVDDLTATFYAGSAIKSEDLNDNFTQNLYKTQEVGARFISNLGGTMTGDLNMGEDTVIRFEGATDNAHETTLTVADPTADRTITLPNVTGTVVTTGDTGTVATAMIAGDAVNGTKIADDSINSEHYVDGSIDTQHIANAQITTAKIADGSVTTDKLAADAVTSAKIADAQVGTEHLATNAVTTVKITADAVTNAKIADDSIDSEHYVDGSIDNAHLADNSVSLAKMANDSVGTAELVDGSVVTAALADNAVTLAKMADNSVGTSEIVDAAVTTAKLANATGSTDGVTSAKIASGAITTTKLQNDAVTNDKLADDSVSTENIQDGDVSTVKLADSGVTTAKIANDAVTTVKIANDAITSAKIADDAVGSTELGDGVIDTVHIGAAQVTTAKIAASAVATSKLNNSAVTTDKITDNAVTINKIGCEQTTISDSDLHIPTSGAVVDYVAAQIAPLGGLEVIATEVAFPNTQPASGVVISISDAGGVVVDGSGTSTTGRTVSGSTVTINGFPASLQSKTMAADIGLMVSSTGSSQTYNYHKILAKEADVEQLSNDINDFANRYRVGSTNPTSALDAGDLFFNTSTSKLLVYNATNSAWEEAQSIGNFFISTFSEAFDGSRTQFTLSNAPANVQQILLSLNGVVQKPGTAFTLSGSTVTLASAPASGTDYFAVVMGSTVNIGQPSNDTVSTAVLQDDSVTAAKIAAGAVGSTELAANAVITSKITDSSITNAKVSGSAAIAGTKISPDFGSQAITTTGTVNTTLLSSAQTGTGGLLKLARTGTANGEYLFKMLNDSGNDCSLVLRDEKAGVTRFTIDSNGTVDVAGNLDVGAGIDVTGDINFPTGDKAQFGDNAQLKIEYDGASSIITAGGNGDLELKSTFDDVLIQAADNVFIRPQGGENGIKVIGDGAVELYHDANLKCATTSSGINVTGQADVDSINCTGELDLTGHLDLNSDSHKIKLGAGDDFQLYHNGNDNYIYTNNGDIIMQTDGDDIQLLAEDDIILKVQGGVETAIECFGDGAVALYNNGTERLTTKGHGAQVSGYLTMTAPVGFCAYRRDTGTADEYPMMDSSNAAINGSYFGHTSIQTPRGQLTTHTTFNSDGAGGSCFSHDGTKFTAPIAGIYTFTVNLSLYVRDSVGTDNSVGWGFFKNQSKVGWSSYDSGLSVTQSSPWLLKDGSTTLSNAYEIGSPSITTIMQLSANDQIQFGWHNMSIILGVRSFIFSGHLLG